MRKFFFALSALFCFTLFLPWRLFAQTQPQLSIVSPQNESISNGRVTVTFDVNRFTLDAKSSSDSARGVISIYLNGKFYTNTATTSSTVQLPRLGTHRIDAQLLHSNRQPVFEASSSSIYVHNQKKTPHIYIANLRNGSTVYSSRPTFQIVVRREQFEDQKTYYQVFVDGKVDGDSQNSVSDFYTLQEPLKEGKHSLRVALYQENGRPYAPVVDALAELTYLPTVPVISSITLEPTATSSARFIAQINGFKIPEQGYLLVRDTTSVWPFTSTSGSIDGLRPGTHDLEFSLVDSTGTSVLPPVIARKSVTIGPVNSVAPVSAGPGSFFFGEGGSAPRWGFVAIASVQAVVILLFGIVLATRHSRKN